MVFNYDDSVSDKIADGGGLFQIRRRLNFLLRLRQCGVTALLILGAQHQRSVEVEKINVPQAEIRTAGVIIALKTLNECKAFCMALNQSVNPLGEFEILLGQSAYAVGHHAQANLVPAVNQNVWVMVQGFGFIGDSVDEIHRAFEILEFQIARQPIAFPNPIREAGKGVLDLFLIQLHLYSPKICKPVRPITKFGRMFAYGMRLAQYDARCID